MRDQPPRDAFSLDDFTQIVERLERELLLFLRSLTGNEDQARDLLQDAFFDGWRAAKQRKAPFTAEHGQDEIRRWLYHAAYCRAISARRHSAVILWSSLDQVIEHVIDDASFENRIMEQDALGAAIASLSPEDAACLLLIVVQRFTAAETAAIMGASTAAIAKRIVRAKRRLRAAYQRHDASVQEGMKP